ncbi:deleted in malignant brain tumors 1 protein-like [Dendronephthya gigantea]|uniref:deleted in malignant brain tumors 1 protein-like n=1 Tax=Dendronephthya gigantea TaxID=151771 RepID=UPI00106CEB45|nr:deleted in malignant brain tumors 1 protein-like [Dendronephthya gigantea]
MAGRHRRIFELKLDELDKVVNETVDASCTLHACDCPCTQTVNSEVGDKKILVSWTEPKPRCPATPNPANPKLIGLFSIGIYTLYYYYTYSDKYGTFGIQCHVIAVTAYITLRLQGSLSKNGTGRVEVFFNRQWGTICAHGWDLRDARVVCRQLGYKDAVRAPYGAQVPDGSGQIWLDEVGCKGMEKNLISCSHRGWGKHDCTHYEDAGVECVSTDIPADITLRLQGSSSKNGTGRVEVFFKGEWGTICDYGWDFKDARVVCRQLGYQDAVRALQGGQVPHGSGRIWLAAVGCKGMEQNLISCVVHRGWGDHYCMHTEDAGLECVSPVCICPWTQIVKAEVRKGETKVLVSWSKPVPSCQTTASPDNPQTTSGWFCVGEHTLIYKYTRSTSSYITDILCHVEIHVTGKDCGRTDYNQITHVCCCGEVHRKKSDFKCCGTEYYNPNNKKCCRGGIVVIFGERCP